MPNHAETIRYYLKTVGPMTMSIEAYPNLDSYQGGVYDDIGEGKPGGHLILLVGYGTETDGTPYWILKNSWSEKWGENGKFLNIFQLEFLILSSNFRLLPNEAWS